jgi:hypothetical protein
MGKTLILQIDELTQGMVQAFQAANDAFSALEESNNSPYVVDGSDPLNMTLSVIALVRNYVFRVQGTTGADTLVIPSEVDNITPVATERVIYIWNETSFDLTVETDTPGDSVVIPAGGVREVLVLGVDVFELARGGTAPGSAHTLAIYSHGEPAASDVLSRYTFVEAVDYLPNFLGSLGSLGVSPTALTLETGPIVFSQVADVNDTVTIYDGQNTTVFTFVASGNGAVGAAVDVTRGASATDSGNNLRTAINNNTNINVTAAGATTTVSLTNNVPFAGSITKSDADNDYVVTNFSGLSVFEIDLQKNGVSVGKAAVGASDIVYFKSASNLAQSFAVGDVFEAVAPASPDASAAEIGFTLKGDRS